jgi:hypothetical protein
MIETLEQNLEAAAGSRRRLSRKTAEP